MEGLVKAKDSSDMKYRSKPVIKEAAKWTGENFEEISRFTDGKVVRHLTKPMWLVVPTLEGQMAADPGDYIVKGLKGEIYPCKPDIFEMTYEPAEDTTSTRLGFEEHFTGKEVVEISGKFSKK